MKPLRIHSFAAGALMLLASAAGAAAQTTTSAILNSLEVQQLIKRGDPGDHARLGVHFAVLAEQHALDARRHMAMAQAFIGQPARRTAVNAAADHCKRLAELNEQSAATLRELATHHEALAAGKSSVVPRGAAPFESGKGAPEPTPEELSALAAKASTPADHRALEEYFRTAATRYTAEVKEHSAMAAAYRGTRAAQAAAHCDRLITLARESAKEAKAMAEAHAGLAGLGRSRDHE